MDIIFIEDLRLPARIGVYPREKVLPQTVTLDLEIGHAPPPDRLDELRATIDYAAVAARIAAELATRRFNLLETLAEHVSRLILSEFPAAQRVRVRAAKLGIMKAAKRVGVIIERERSAMTKV